jgi:ribose/xylose/arabinose/galactoside ABC-type transport system permease subunit
MHISGYWQKAIMGAIILITIAIDAIGQARESDQAIKVDVAE